MSDRSLSELSPAERISVIEETIADLLEIRRDALAELERQEHVDTTLGEIEAGGRG